MNTRNPIARLASSKRILVLGSSGSGKTTFAIALARIMNIRVIHLDAHFWQPGWIHTPQSQWRGVVSSLTQMESWVMDGTYESTLDLRVPMADAVVLIERGRLGCLWRVLKRRMMIDDATRPDAPAGQRVDAAFLRYIWQYPSVTRPLVYECLRKYGSGKTIVPLKGAAEVARCLDEIQTERIHR